MYHDDVAIEILTDINVALHDGVVSSFVNTGGFLSENRWLEQRLGSAETKVSAKQRAQKKIKVKEGRGVPLVANSDDLTIREFVALFETGGLSCRLDFLFKVEGNITQFLLNVTDDFSFGGGGEAIAAFSEDLHEVISKITSSKVESENGVGQGIS